MEREHAQMLVAALMRMYPDSYANEATADGWISYLMTLHDFNLAMEAINAVVVTEKRFPSIARFKEEYAAMLRRRRDSQAAIEQRDSSETGLPQTQQEWEALGRFHRRMRAADFSQMPDPAADTPLPKNRREFNLEWSKFLTLLYADTSLAKSWPE